MSNRSSHDSPADRVPQYDERLWWSKVRDSHGRTIRFRVIGQANSLVVLDAGFANAERCWGNVARLIGSFSSVLVIDRSGFHRWPADQYTLEQIAGSTLELIASAGSPGPVIFVGMGTGTLIARHLIDGVHGRFGGCLLIDPVPEHAHQFTRHDLRSETERGDQYVTRLLMEIEAVATTLGADFFDYRLPHQVSELPLTVITRGSLPAQDDALAQLWISAQLDQLPRTSRSRHIIAGRGEQSIPNERPDVVVSAIRELVSRQLPCT